MIGFKQFKPVGVYVKDIREYTGYADVIGACKKSGVVLWRLGQKRYAPLSVEDTLKVIAYIRAIQGKRFIRAVERDYDTKSPKKQAS